MKKFLIITILAFSLFQPLNVVHAQATPAPANNVTQPAGAQGAITPAPANNITQPAGAQGAITPCTADQPCDTTPTVPPAVDAFAGKDGIYTGLSESCYTKGNCEICDLVGVANNIVKIILGLAGGVALVVAVLSGFYLLISSGGEYKKKAYNSAVAAITGLFIIFFSYTVINVAINVVTGAANVTDPAKIFGTEWVKFCEDSANSFQGTTN